MLYSIYVYKSNVITQAWVYKMINLAKPRVFVGISSMIYDCPSEMVPEQFFLLVCHCFFYNYNPVRHILELVYNMPLVKYQYYPLGTFLAKLGQKNILFAYAIVGH